MVMVRDILMYMDRTYVPQNRRRPVYELGLHLFRTTVWEHPRVQPRVTQLLLDAVASERAGLLTDDRTLLKQNISMLLELGAADSSNVYERDFETLFLGTTQEFYHRESLDFLSKNTAIDYVAKAQARLDEEKVRAAALGLAQTTEGPLQNIVETELIERHAESLVKMENSGFAALLKDETKVEQLRDMYDLLVRVPSSVDFLRDALSERVKTDGSALIADQERGQADPPAFVRGVLKMRDRYGNVVSTAFRGEKRAAKRLRESFEDFLNADARAASCLAIYVDELLRTGLKGATEAQVTAELHKVILVFRYLSDKDVFESYYKQHLAKRLLNNKSVSDEAERAMVSQLKAECGYQFTSKLEGMFNDMRISRDTRDAYNTHKKTQQARQAGGGVGKSVDIQVDVLTTGYWPSQNVPPCTLPAPVNEAIERFSEFYLEKHTGRKLSWQTSTGSAELRATFGTGPNKYRRHDLCISTYQMCILMLFNEKSSLTLGEIRTATAIPDQELRRHLISLCTPKHRILRKGSKGKAITSDSDTFTFNADFTSKMRRVRVPLVSMKETATGGSAGAPGAAGTVGADGAAAADGSGGAVPANVEEDRRHLVEAAIVRIMKARKMLHHNDLIAEVTKQLSVRFVPSPQFIKKRVESLIEREYLEREENDRRMYTYVA
jgi:cullin 3